MLEEIEEKKDGYVYFSNEVVTVDLKDSHIDKALKIILSEGRICDPEIKILKQEQIVNNPLLNKAETEFIIKNAKNWSKFVKISQKKKMVLLALAKKKRLNPTTLYISLKKHNVSRKLIHQVLNELQDWKWVNKEEKKRLS